MDMSRSVDATANVAQEMIEAQRRSYEAMTDAVVEGQKRGVRFAHSSARSLADNFGSSFGSGQEKSGPGREWTSAAYGPVRLGQQWTRFLQSWMSAGSDYAREQAEANQQLYKEFEKSARAQRESFRRLGQEWMDLYRESASNARSQAEEGVKTFQQAADQGLHAVANGHDSANGHSAAGFPISGYQDLSVNDVFQHLRTLSRDNLQKVRAYETENKNRSSLVNELDRRIKAAS